MLPAAVGLWAGYDRTGALAIFDNPVGWQKFWGLALALLFYYALAGAPNRAALRGGVALLAGVGAATALYFAANRDWAQQPVDWEAFTVLGRALQALLFGGQRWPGLEPNVNVVGGVLAPLLCLDVGLLLDLRRSRSRWAWIALLWGTLTAFVMALGVLATASRGAWLSLAVAAYLALVWQGLRARVAPERRWGKFLAWAARDGALAAMFLLLPWFRALLTQIPDIANRLWIFTRGALLVRDFPFTGCGLGGFALPDSTYAELIHVPTLAYSHSVVLDAAVEQGLPGALALLAIWAFTFWRGLWAVGRRAAAPPPLLVAGLLALLAQVLHGLGDDPFGASLWLPLLWSPVAVVMAELRLVGDKPSPWQRGLGGVLVAGALAAGVWGVWRMGPALPAAWYANLGAVAQAHAELPLYDYHHFAERTLDDIRRREDFTATENYYRLALAFDAAQVTARTRLAQLALSRGDYDAALEHARAAWDAGYRDRVTTLTYSDALIAHGDVDAGAGLARGLPRAEMRLEWQWYRYHDRGDAVRQAYVEQALEWLK